MTKAEIVSSVTRNFYKVGFQLKKYSPEILVVTGVVGVVASAVMACKATTKISTITEKTKATVDAIHNVLEDPDMADEYSPEDGKRDLAITYAQAGLEFAKLYGPAVLLGAASIGCIFASHNISHKRITALGAAYTAVASDFKNYSNRVIDRFGKELDRELRYGIKAKEIEETVVDEDGTETVVKKTVDVVDDPSTYSAYARFFDETCPSWDKNSEYNLMFLKQVQNHANDMLKSRGHVYLNEVYDMIGIPRSMAGQIVGWVYDEKNPVGDNFIDFGITDVHRERVRAFVNGYERSILLDFNVDGNILELMH